MVEDPGADRKKGATLVEPDDASAAPADATAGDWRYEIVGEHARGGLGRVLIARDRQLGRTVAIKELLVSGGVAEERFRREARLTANLEHPSVVPVHDAGLRPDRGSPFYAMKLVSGRPLEQAVSEAGSLEARLALLPALVAVADAVAYAHSQRVIHRDLKPANVLLGAYGETVVIDWGLAKHLDSSDADAADAAPAPDDGALTVAGAVLGTPAYMAPEQARGEPADARADVYALGAMLYFVLAGEPPYRGRSSQEILASVRQAPPPPLPARLAIPDDLAAIVARAMARGASARYPDAGALAADLRRFLNGQLVAAHRYSWPERLARWTRRHRGVAAATTLFLLAGLVAGAAFTVREQRLRRVAESERRARADQERARADTERGLAEQQTVALLEEHGRRELADGRPLRAAVYLAEAYRRAPTRLALRYLVSEAIRPLAARELTLLGHTRDVVGLAFSPDGATLVSASSDHSARVWDVASGTVRHLLTGHSAGLNAVALSSDGALVATAAGDHSVRLYRADSGALVRVIDDDDPYRVALTPNGLLLVGSHDGQVRAYDVATGVLRLAARTHVERVYALTVSPDGQRFVSGGWDGEIVLWDTRRLVPIARVGGQQGGVSSAVYSKDGLWLVTAGADGPVLVRRAKDGQVVRTIAMPPGQRWTQAFLPPDGQTLVTTSADVSLRVWHLASGEPLLAIDPEAGGKLFVGAMTADGQRVATAGIGGTIHVWRLDQAAAYHALAPPLPDRIVVTSSFVAGGQLLLTGSEQLQGVDGVVELRQARSGALVRSFHGEVDPWSMASDATGRHVLVAGETIDDARRVAIWDAESGQRLATLDAHRGIVFRVAASADGARFASAGADGTVRQWDARTGQPVGPVLVLGERATAVAFDPGGPRLLTAGESGRLVVWDSVTGARLREWSGSKSWIQDLAYSADGRTIVSAGRQDHTARLWNAADGALLHELVGHVDNLMTASLSPDGRLAATVSVDGQAMLWDVASGERLREWTGPAYSVAFAPDGGALFTSAGHGYAITWSLALDARDPEAIATFVAARSPWQLVDGRLVERPAGR